MLEALKLSLAPEAVVAFIVYLAGAIVLFHLFKFAYTRITPHKEFALIREGNVAAAVAFAGALIGFAIPASNVIAFSVSILDFIVWAVIAGIVQLLGFLISSVLVKGASERIKNGEVATGIYVAAVSICLGLFNAACMTPAS
ncbi:hypothetical protein D3C78_1183720 [compost metagenome]